MKLFRHFILRPLAGEKVRTATTVIGVALGIAVVIAIQLTNASSIRGFETALETVAGKTAVEIIGAGTGIDESRLREVSWLREFGVISPVIEGSAALVVGDVRSLTSRRQMEAVKVLGIDILRDQPFRDYELLEIGGLKPAATSDVAPGFSRGITDDFTTQQFLEILTNERSVVITEKLAQRRGYEIGGELRLMIGDRVLPFVVRGYLKNEGPARVLDGNFILMDIAAAQLAFDRLGRVDRIDVLLSEGSDLDQSLQAIAAKLPPGLSAQRPARRGEQVETMLAAFHTNLTALSWIALIVGLFLVYNTVTISVVARREEIGMLRALGVTRGTVLRLFLGEAAALAAAGILLGLGLARLLADAALTLTSRTVSTLYIAAAAAPPEMNISHLWTAIAIGLPLSLIAAAVPALEASRVPPTAAIRGHDTLEMRTHLRPGALLLPAALLVIAYALAQLPPIGRRPVFAYAASFAVVIGAAFLVPAIMFGLAKIGRVALRRRLGVEGLLAHANLTSAIPRLSISVAALAVSLSMMVAIAVMIGSFRDTVVYWLGQTLRADLFIGPGIRPTVGSEQTISEDVIATLSTHPDLVAMDRFRNLDLVYNGNLAVLGAGSFEVVLQQGSLLFKSPADARERLRAAIGKDEVIVSEPFSMRYGKRDGDLIDIPTPQGSKPFRIAAVYYDYASDRGVVVMDRSTFTRHFGELPPSGVAAYLREGADPERVRTEMLDMLDEGHRAFIYSNRTLRTEVLNVFDSTFAITYALELIAITVAMLGVAGTLLTLVLERRRELSLLRLTGADRRQVRRMVIIEAALIGGVSQGIGLAVGFALSAVLIYVINVQSFGWTIQFHLPAAFLIQASIAVVIATAIAGIYPARRAAQLVLSHDE
ncbi:MAG TPA: FtsX-like permease family protein [Vicinamibacterales bacterium]|nr:FtsX-like permease family protein [Vicinamibacterales bacterium]